MYTVSRLHKRNAALGYTLLEMLVALAIASFIVVVIIQLLTVYMNSYVTYEIATRINTAGIITGERIAREVKQATSVDVGGSTFGISPGKLLLNTASGGASATIEFYLDGTTVKMKKDGTVFGVLTGENVSVDALIFYLVVSGDSQLVKIEMDISSGSGSSTRSAVFYTSATLRGT